MGWLAGVGLFGLMVGSWWVVREVEPGSLKLGSAVEKAQPRFPPSSAPLGAGADEREVFREIVAARDTAMAEALKVAPIRGGSLVGPTGRRDTAKKRAAVVAQYMSRALEHIAATRGLNVREVEVIYDRGRREDWAER